MSKKSYVVVIEMSCDTFVDACIKTASIEREMLGDASLVGAGAKVVIMQEKTPPGVK